MERDVNELAKRRVASEAQYIGLEHAYIFNRLFSRARLLALAHPGSAVERFHAGKSDVLLRIPMASVPNVSDHLSPSTNATTVFAVDHNGSRLVHRAISIGKAVQIIVVISPQCHFAQDGLTDILSDPSLAPFFARHAVWLTPSTELGFAELAAWNKTHPTATMFVAYSPQQWPMITSWDTPTFYFLSHGKVISEVIGWPKEGRKPQIRAAIRRLKASTRWR